MSQVLQMTDEKLLKNYGVYIFIELFVPFQDILCWASFKSSLDSDL